MGFISANHAQIPEEQHAHQRAPLEAARVNGVRKLLFTSSACVHPDYLQEHADVEALREEQAYPAAPQDAYGWGSS